MTMTMTLTTDRSGHAAGRRLAAPSVGWRRIAIAAATAALVATTVGLSGSGATATGSPRPVPAPAPARITADFPENANIHGCVALATRSAAIDAPRSDRANSIVGPLYADACLGA